MLIKTKCFKCDELSIKIHLDWVFLNVVTANYFVNVVRDESRISNLSLLLDINRSVINVAMGGMGLGSDNFVVMFLIAIMAAAPVATVASINIT